MRKDKTLNSKNYNKEMSQIVNLILQLKQLVKKNKHRIQNQFLGEKSYRIEQEIKRNKKKMKTNAKIINNKRGLWST